MFEEWTGWGDVHGRVVDSPRGLVGSEWNWRVLKGQEGYWTEEVFNGKLLEES